MRKEVILAIVVIGVVWIAAAVYFMTKPKQKVSSFKEVRTQTLEEVEIKKISDELPRGLYEVKVNDSTTVLIYSHARGNSMIRIK
jgi:hypothetical protein